MKMLKFLLSLIILKLFGFEPWIILNLLLQIEGTTKSENQKIIFKSLLMSNYIIKQKKLSRITNVVSIVKKLIHKQHFSSNPQKLKLSLVET